MTQMKLVNGKRVPLSTHDIRQMRIDKARWEAEMEQNVEAMEALQAKRLAVKAKYPKPSKE